MPRLEHSWILSEENAVALQIELSKTVITNDRFNRDINLVAGVDVAYSKCDNRIYSAVVILAAATLAVVEIRTATDVVTFPYIPGLFAFREIPPIIKALSLVENVPDLIVCDGQGIAHPRRFGLASHLGVLFDTPSIGCAKTKLFGESLHTPQKRGEYAELYNGDDVVGCELCTQDGIKPLYVSLGHRISLKSARSWILALAPKYRLPETTRKANETVNLLRNSSL